MVNRRKLIVSFTAEPELVDYLNRMALADHTSVSQYIRNVLWTGLSLEEYRDTHKEELNEVVHKITTAVDLEHKF